MQIECPCCHKTILWEQTPTRPFCSPRCQLIDLGGWAKGDYAIPSEETIQPDDLNTPE